MVNSDNKLMRKGFIFGLIVAGLIVAGAVLAIYKSSIPSKLAILKAEDTPIKTAPEDPGGLKLNSIDSPVMALLDKKTDEEGVEVLRPPVTEPELPPIKIEETVSTEGTVPTEENVSAEGNTSTEGNAPTEGNVSTEGNTSTKSNTSTEGNTSTKENVSAEPLYFVQFAAFKNETRAKNAAAILSTKHESRLSGITLGHVKGDKYWRVKTESMPREEATALCSMFRSVGQDCILKMVKKP
jgi:hypothetical protein